MSRIARFSYATLPVSRWRNGGGETREIACWAPLDQRDPAANNASQAGFAWRASIATIDSNGAFSTFPGIDRIITLLEGEGVRLINGDRSAHELSRPGEPYAFAGEAPIEAELLGGASRDFNIMTRRGDWRSSVRRLTTEQILPAGHSGVVYIMAGHWRLLGDESEAFETRQGAWWHLSSGAMRLLPAGSGAVALWADISPA